MNETFTAQFVEAAKRVGAVVFQADTLLEAADYIKENVEGISLVPETPLATRHKLAPLLTEKNVNVFDGDFREAGQIVGGGITFSNFAMADSGTIALESTDEDVRLATTLAEKHFIFVDPTTILEDNLAAVAPMTEMHKGNEGRFIAYITGPSRTADIERVLTIGCHGPRELHIILLNDISSDLLEN